MLNYDDYQVILRSDFVSFNERAFYELNPQADFKPALHIEAIATKLEACRKGLIRRLVINLPPRHLKSHTASIAYVAWLLGHHPAAQIICASYGQDLADKLARDCRTVMSSSWYQELFPTRLLGRGAVSDFITTQQGGRMSTSVGGMLTGRGADVIIIDDPLKPDEALSETQRTAVNDWYQNTLLSRLNDKETGCIIIIMQRLHQDDLVGHVTEREKWEVLSFPAIAEEYTVHTIESALGNRLFARNPGDILHPQRESKETLAKIRKNIGEYNFVSQYQQTPTPPGGAMVKLDWLRFHEPHEKPERFLRIVQSWDTANKAGELNDYSVCTTWGVDGKRRFLLHVLRKKMNYPDLKRTVIELAKEYNATNVLIEDKASGIQLIQELERELYSTVTAYKPPTGTDKIMRLHAQTDLFENGLIYLPKDASWLQDYILELTGFPGTRHDDQVDSTAQALDHMRIPSALEIWAKLGSQL
jgi:predicted phage terminase large subunit-like protein